MRDLLRPSTWFDHHRTLWMIVACSALAALLVVLSFGPTWADAGPAPLQTPTPVAVQTASGSAKPISPIAAAEPPITRDALDSIRAHYDERLRELESRNLDVLTRIVESRSKTVDWWLAFLGTFTAVIGVLGALVPFLLTRTLRDQSAIDRQQIEATRSDVLRMKADAEQLVNDAKVDAQKIANHQREAAAAVENIKGYLPSHERSDSNSALPDNVADAAREVRNDPNAQMLDRLRAEALLADKSEEADKATSLWEAVVQLAPTDPQALFMSGYWHYELAERAIASKAIPEARQLLARSGERYQQALAIKPNMHEAANNWGNVMNNEATAIVAADLPEARRLWAQAGECYQQALAVRPDMHEAANNWGNVMNNEATAIAAANLPEARRLWARAGERFQQALAIKPDKYEAAYNWGLALGNEATAIAATDLPDARQLWARAGGRFQQALAIKPDMHEAAYGWAIVLGEEATAIAAADLPEARSLWAQAGARYQQALAMKPDMHEAANNWGNVLDKEATAIAAADLPEARALWAQAGARYRQALAIKPDKHEAASNWGAVLNQEATAIAAVDLPQARRLWAEAGERYQQALALKPDMHQAANNWGNALLNEATAIAATDLPDAQRLWAQAAERYQQAIEIRHDTKRAAYNIACVKALLGLITESVHWLDTARLNNDLPSREHLESDTDLDGIRQSPEFVAWWNAHFNPSGEAPSDG